VKHGFEESQLKKVGSDDFQEALTKTTVSRRNYSKKSIPFGYKKTKRGNTTKQMYHLDMSKPIRLVKQGATRSGKTFNIRGLTNRMSRAGYNIVFNPDVKDEFKTNNKALSDDDLEDNLLDREEPEITPTITFRPTFFRDLPRSMGELSKNNKWYSINPLKLSFEEWKILLAVQRLPDDQQKKFNTMIKRTLSRIEKMDDFDSENIIEEFYETIDAMRNIKPEYKENYKGKIEPLEHVDMFDAQHRYDLTSLLEETRIETREQRRPPVSERLNIAFNLEDYDEFDSTLDYPKTFFAITMKKLIDAAKFDDLTDDTVIVIDEAPQIIDKDSGYSTEFIDQSVRRDAAYGIHYVFAAQELIEVSEVIIKNASHLCVPYQAETDAVQRGLKRINAVKGSKTYNLATRIQSQMMEEYDWIVFDFRKMKWEVIRPIPPLSEHL